MAYEFREFPERSWSISKLNTFKQCKRKYYFCTYGHWNGWVINSPSITKLTYRLNKLEDVYTLSGTYLHNVIKGVIQGNGLTAELMYDEIMNKLRLACNQSIKNIEQWKNSPKAYTVLHEYYYGGKLSEQLADEIKSRAKVCCANLFKSRSFQELTEDPIEIIELDESNAFNNFLYEEDIKIYCTLDALYKSSGEIVVADWKTGRPDDEQHRLQMLVYLLYLIEKYNFDIERIRCVDEYLLTGERYTNTFDLNDIVEIKQYINDSILNLNNYLEDIRLNKPKDISVFPPSPSKLCSSCNFLEICREHQIVD